MKELVTIASFIYKSRIFILWILFISILLWFAFAINKAIADGRFFLLHEDEVIYYCSGKLFAETNSLQAEGCIEENVSPIGKMNWYGPGYNIIYGTVFKIFGDAPSVFIWFNVFLALSTVVTIFFLKTGIELKLIVAISLMVSQQFCVYIFTYFPETLILCQATVLTVLLLNFHHADHSSRQKFLAAFIICAFLFMICRITFIFWLAALLPFAENRKAFIYYLSTFVGGVILSLMYMKFFTAPPFASSMHKIGLLFSGHLADFVVQTLRSFFENLMNVFKERTSVINVLLGLIVASGALYWFKRNRLLLSAFLVSICLVSVMFAYYLVSHFYFIKQTAMLLPLLICAIVVGTPLQPLRYTLIFVMLAVFPSPVKKTMDAISDGRNAYVHYENNVDFRKSLNEIPAHIQLDATNVLYCYNEFDYGNAAEALLPFATKGQNPILYTTNIVDARADAATKFAMHQRLKIHYILSREKLTADTLLETHATKYYYLYKLKDQ